MKKISNNLGFGLIEILVSMLTLSMIILGVYSLIVISVRLTADNQSYVEAIEIGNQRIERIRNMSYDDIGTASGSPVGLLDEYEYVTRSTKFTVHNTVMFYDDPYDGTLASGTDAIFVDYKIATVEISWQGKYEPKSITYFTKIIPNTEETLSGYGLLKLIIVDSSGAPVPSANIHIENPANSLSVDLSSDSNGELSYPVLPDFEGYEVTVTKTDYGIDKSYDRNAVNINPSKPHLSVYDGVKTEESFSIDKLAALTVKTVSKNTLPDNWQINNDSESNDKINSDFGLDSADNIYFAWEKNSTASSSIMIQKYDSSKSQQWINDISISSTNFQSNPAISVLDNGTSFIVWQDNSTTLKQTAKAIQIKKYAQNNTIYNYPKLNLNISPLISYSLKNELLNNISFLPIGILNKDYNFYSKIIILKNNLIDKSSTHTAYAAASTITLVGVGPGDTTGNNFYITIDVPSGVQEDDFLLAYIYQDYYYDGPVNPPGGYGWNTLDDTMYPAGESHNNSRGALFWKIAGASEPSDYTFSMSYGSEQKAGHIRAYRGVDPSDPFDGNLVKDATKRGDHLRAAPSHTVSNDGSMLVCGWGSDTRSLGDNSPTFPTSMTNTINNYADYITAASADMQVSISDSPTSAQNFDANQYTSHASTDWSLVLKPLITADDITVSSIGSQISSTTIPSSSLYIGGTFSFVSNSGSHNITSVTLSENGTAHAQNDLDSIKLYYDLDTTPPYNCSSETYDETSDPQFGASAVFDSGDGTATFTDSINVTTTQTLCLYPVIDLNSNAGKFETINLFINNPTTDVLSDTGNIIPASTIDITNSTTIYTPTDLQQIHYRWQNDDGDEDNATWSSGLDISDSIIINDIIRLRIQISNEGAIPSESINYQLEYGEKISSCDAIASWHALPTDNSLHWKIKNSSYLTDNATTSDIDGITNNNPIFVEGYIKDEDNQTSGIILTDLDFTEIVYSISATTNATDSNYCFRLTNSGSTNNFSYITYPEINIIGDDNIYILSLDSSGNELWPVKKVNSNMGNNNQTHPKISTIEDGINATSSVVWLDGRNGNVDLYAQLFDINGNKLWSNDLQITNTSYDESYPDTAIDSEGNIYYSWTTSTSSLDIYINKFDFNGNNIWPSSKAIASTSEDEYESSIKLDSNNDAYVIWTSSDALIKDIYLAKYASTSIKEWEIQPNFDNSNYNQDKPSLYINSTDIYTSWTDDRDGNNDIYTQRLDLDGNIQWLEDLKLNTNSNTTAQTNSKVMINSSNNTFAVWEDARNTSYDIYATSFTDPALLTNIPNVPFSITGTKQIGDSPVIYETNDEYYTDINGEKTILVEWDNPGYTLDLVSASTTYNLFLTEPILPLQVNPDDIINILLYVE